MFMLQRPGLGVSFDFATNTLWLKKNCNWESAKMIR